MGLTDTQIKDAQRARLGKPKIANVAYYAVKPGAGTLTAADRGAWDAKWDKVVIGFYPYQTVQRHTDYMAAARAANPYCRIFNYMLFESLADQFENESYRDGTAYLNTVRSDGIDGWMRDNVHGEHEVTFTASSAVIAGWKNHGLTRKTKVRFTTTGVLPAEIAINTDYYVIQYSASVYAATNSYTPHLSQTAANLHEFRISATEDGAAITFSSAGVGVHTCISQQGRRWGGAYTRATNLTSYAPVDSNGKRWPTYWADKLDTLVFEASAMGGFDGVFIDNLFPKQRFIGYSNCRDGFLVRDDGVNAIGSCRCGVRIANASDTFYIQATYNTATLIDQTGFDIPPVGSRAYFYNSTAPWGWDKGTALAPNFYSVVASGRTAGQVWFKLSATANVDNGAAAAQTAANNAWETTTKSIFIDFGIDYARNGIVTFQQTSLSHDINVKYRAGMLEGINHWKSLNPTYRIAANTAEHDLDEATCTADYLNVINFGYKENCFKYCAPTLGLTSGFFYIAVANAGNDYQAGFLFVLVGLRKQVKGCRADGGIMVSGLVTIGQALTPAATTCSTTSDSNVLTSVASIEHVAAGIVVTGTGIPADATITSIDPVTKDLTLSANCTATGTGIALTYGIRMYEYSFLRFTLAASLLCNNAYLFGRGADNVQSLKWYDEYDLNLGEPIDPEPTAKFGTSNCWVRRYQGGIAIANPMNTPQAVDVTSLGTYKRFLGTQDAVANNGQNITGSIVLAPQDGLILLSV